MPRGASPYLSLLQFAVKQLHARAGFLYLDGGVHGSSWCVWAPPEVAARLREFLDDAAEDLIAHGTEGSHRVVTLGNGELGEIYRDAAEAACRAAEAEFGFIFLLEGKRGTGWSLFAPPELNPLMVGELLHGFASDLKGEEPVLRGEATLQ